MKDASRSISVWITNDAKLFSDCNVAQKISQEIQPMKFNDFAELRRAILVELPHGDLKLIFLTNTWYEINSETNRPQEAKYETLSLRNCHFGHLLCTRWCKSLCIR